MLKQNDKERHGERKAAPVLCIIEKDDINLMIHGQELMHDEGPPVWRVEPPSTHKPCVVC